jgi:glycosyltransferase involved in cell wall biosynthesis
MNPPTKRPQPKDTLLSIVLPVFNEVEALTILAGRIVKALWNSNVEYEMIFVNDGSTDGSGALLDQLAADCPAIRVVHFARNFGHQAAVQAGLAYARGDTVVLMDSDLQDAPEAVPEMLRRWQDGDDVVYAVRCKRKESGWKRLGFAAFHRLLARSATVPIPAEAGIFGLIDRRVAQEILALPERDRYFPGLRSWVGLRQSGIVVERQARYDDMPRVSLRGLFRLAKTAIFSFSTLPLTVFHVVGLAAAVIFVGWGGFALFVKLFTALSLPGWTSTALLGSFFAALNALGFSILGEYLIRIYDQVRGRPLYLVDRTVNIKEVPLSLRERVGVRANESSDAVHLDLMREAEALLDAAEQAARQSQIPVPASSAELPDALQAFPHVE